MKAKAGVRPAAQRAGVSKIPAWLVAKLYSGAAYMCCFDGGVTWGEELHEGGGGACFFRIRSNGVKNEHWPGFDQTVFLADWAAVMITTSARSWLTVKIISRHAWVPRKCRGRGSGWSPVPA